MAHTLEKRRIGISDLDGTTLGLGTASLAGIFSAVPAAQGRATIVHVGVTHRQSTGRRWGEAWRRRNL